MTNNSSHMQQLSKRLEHIKTSIVLGDIDIVELQLQRIVTTELDAEMTSILTALTEQQWSKAIKLIDNYLNRHNGLVIYDDPELAALRLELKKSEQQVEQLSEQYDDQLFLLDRFQYRYQIELGDTIRIILQLDCDIQQERLRLQQEDAEQKLAAYRESQAELKQLKQEREQLESELENLDLFEDRYDEINERLDEVTEQMKSQQEQVHQQRQQAQAAKEILDGSPEKVAFEEAEQSYEAFEEDYQEIVQVERVELEGDAAKEMQQLFKRAAQLCHPDLVADEKKEQANQLMKTLNEARTCGDLKTIKELYQQLQLGLGFEVASEQLTDKTQLRAKIEQLLQKINELQQGLDEIEDSANWKQMPEKESWDSFFSDMQQVLKQELMQRQDQLNELTEEKRSAEANQKLDEYNWQRQKDAEENYWHEEF